MKNLLMTTAFAIALTGPAFAAGSHSGGHGDDHADKHAEMMAVGKPGTAADVTRTIAVTMRETEDGDMIFEPDNFAFEQGETIRFEVTNKGERERKAAGQHTRSCGRQITGFRANPTVDGGFPPLDLPLGYWQVGRIERHHDFLQAGR